MNSLLILPYSGFTMLQNILLFYSYIPYSNQLSLTKYNQLIKNDVFNESG